MLALCQVAKSLPFSFQKQGWKRWHLREVLMQMVPPKPPPALPLFKGSGSSPSIWYFLPVPTSSQSHGVRCTGKSKSTGDRPFDRNPAHSCERPFVKFWDQGHTFAFQDYLPQSSNLKQPTAWDPVTVVSLEMLFNQPVFLTVCGSFIFSFYFSFFLMQLCAICITTSICIGIKSSSVLDAGHCLLLTGKSL